MTLWYFTVAASALMLAAGGANADDKIAYGPAPAWVKPVPFPSTPENKSSSISPDRVALLNVQVNLTDDTVTTYTETVTVAPTSGIVEQSPISIRWDAATEKPVINKVEIHRGSQVIDLLAAGQSFSLPPPPLSFPLPVETVHERTLSATFTPRDVQAGDVLVVAWTIIHIDPALKGHIDAVVTDTTYSPVDELHVRALWPKTKTLQWKGTSVLKEATHSSTDDGNELAIDRRNVVAPVYVPAANQGFQRPRLVLTDFSDWSDIATLLAPTFTTAAKLDVESPLRAEAAHLRAESSDPKVQVIEALRYLQSHIRRQANSGDAVTAFPESADAIWNLRKADAKGTVIALTAFLRAMDLKATPALSSQSFGHSLNTVLPDIYAFDHLLVRVEIGEKTYWLDPFVAEDRDLDHLTPPLGLFWALPLLPQAKLENLTPPVPSQPLLQTVIRIDATAGLDVPATVHIERTFRGTSAVGVGSRLDGLPPVQLDSELRRLFQPDYPWLQVGKTQRSYDPTTGELHVVVDGSVHLQWQTGNDLPIRQSLVDSFVIRGQSQLRSPGIYVHSADETAATRTYSELMADIPVNVPYPSWSQTEEIISLPNGGKGFGLKGDGAVDTTLMGVRYQRTVKLTDGLLSAVSSSQSLVPDVSRSAGIADTPALEALGADSVWLLAPLDYAMTPADKAAADASRPATSQGFYARGSAYLKNGENSAAVADFDESMKLGGDWPEVLVARGIAKGRLKDLDGAEMDFKAAQVLDPHNAPALVGEGAACAERKDYDGAIDAISKAIELEPKAPDMHLMRARFHMLKKDYAAAAADAQTELQISPAKPLLATSVLIDAYVALGKTEEALALARLLAAKYPNEASVHSQLGALLGCLADNLHECHPDRSAAFDEFSKSIALHPTAYAYANRAQSRPLKNTDQRMSDLNAALALEPNSDFALLTRAALYLYEKLYDKALADANTVLAKTPNDLQALNIRAIVYGQQKQYELQMADLNTILRLDPKNASALNSSCWARAIRNVELDKALDNCNAAIALFPAAGYYDSRALVYFRLGRLDDALGDYNTALTKRPDQASSLYGRGLVELRKGQGDAAKADMARAVAIDPRVAGTYNDMGLSPSS